MAHFQDAFWVGNGFDVLHRHMKLGNELCRDMESLFADRANLEKDYANGLQKMVKKARKASKKCVGSIADVWLKLVAGLEAEDEVHRALSLSLSQDCAKSLKVFTEAQVKQREPIETAVDKQNKLFMDKSKSQLRAKKSAHKQCRELEVCWDQLQEVKAGRGKPMSERDVHRLEKNCRKMEEGLIRMDRDYRESNIKTEETRLGWESAMYRCCDTMETLEVARLQETQQMLAKYCELVETIIRPTESVCEELLQSAETIDPQADVEVVCISIGTGPNQPQQLLLDCYEEELGSHMKLERRCGSLEKKIQAMEEEIDRQEKARKGVESLAKVYTEQPDFTDQKGAEDVSRQLVEVDAMLNMLKANHYKLLCAHAEISNAPRPSSHFSSYISTTKDKAGHTMSMLSIPVENISEVQQESGASPAVYTIPKKSVASPPSYDEIEVPAYHADGNGQLDSSDEHLQRDGGGEKLTFNDTQHPNGDGYLTRCEVLYDYTANQEDELTIEPGDIIDVTDQQDQDWWTGELNGRSGIFPASYVQEMS